jgi:hypothetical protein
MIGVTALSRRNFKLEKSLKCKRFSFIPLPDPSPHIHTYTHAPFPFSFAHFNIEYHRHIPTYSPSRSASLCFPSLCSRIPSSFFSITMQIFAHIDCGSIKIINPINYDSFQALRLGRILMVDHYSFVR